MPSELYRTCLEKQMYGYLTELGLVKDEDYYEQYPFGNYVLDFAFIQSRKPFRGVDIETDGIMWHSSGEQRKRDGYRTYKLMKAGWLVERFGESFSIKEVEQVLIKHNLIASKDEGVVSSDLVV
jgi:very-short-patch-repair endonuclease